MSLIIGGHLNVNKGDIIESIKDAQNIGADVLQIFVGSPMSFNFNFPLIADDKLILIKNYLKETNIKLVVHGSYLYNFCDTAKEKQYARMLSEELKLDDKMNSIGSVIHLGSKKDGQTYDEAIDQFVQGIRTTLSKYTPVNAKIILETTAGQGNSIGKTIEQFADLYNKFTDEEKRYIGLCIDTCHIFSVGYDINTVEGMNNYFNTFDELIGLENLTLFHLNDSKTVLGSKKDRHENLTKGNIFSDNLDSLNVLKNIAIKYNVPIILETHDKDPYDTFKAEMKLVRDLDTDNVDIDNTDNTDTANIDIIEKLPTMTVEELEDLIVKASDSYYNKGKSLMTDNEFDLLTDRLKQLNPKSKILKQVGAEVRGKKVQLPYWLGSMDKIKTDEKTLNRWIKTYKGPYVLSEKLDGISALLNIEKGKNKLYTKGDGTQGSDISHLISIININIDKLPKNIDIAIRGELVITKNKFKQFSNEMSSTRDLVKALANTKPTNVNKIHAKNVDFVAYEIVTSTQVLEKQLAQLEKWKLNVVYYELFDEIDLEMLEKTFNIWRKQSEYDIDGIIVTDNNKYERNVSGNPKYSFAYKGPNESADVEVIEVLWDVSKDNVLIPTIHYTPVKLSGAILQYTSGFNARYIDTNKIGTGAIITISRSGDVIPHILAIVKPAKESGLPLNRPYHWENTKNKVHIISDDPDDNDMYTVKRITKFVKDIGVDNMGQGIVAKLVEAGYKSIPDIITIKVKDLLEIEGFKKTLANKLYDNLQDALSKLDILTFMSASNMLGKGISRKKLQKILEVYPNIIEDYNDKDIWYDRLIKIEGLADISVNEILDSLPEFIKFYNEISEIVEIKPYKVAKAASVTKAKLKDQTIVFTGFRDKKLQEFIESEGGKVNTSVSKNTNLLIYDGKDIETNAKYIKATDLGIEMITKQEFIEKYM